MSYERVISEFRSKLWAVQEETFEAMLQLMATWSTGAKLSAEEVAARIRQANYGLNRVDDPRETRLLASDGSRRGGGSGSSGNVAVIPILGLISNRTSMFSDISAGGGSSVQKITAQLRSALNNPSVKAIVFDVDSPGGNVDAVPELAAEIYGARGRKRLISVSNGLAASAAYWIACAASEFFVCPSGQCGSIGVYMSLEDRSKQLEKEGVKITRIKAGKFKAEGVSDEPLSDSARQHFQEQVDDVYSMFVAGVATCRRASQADVRAGYGQGRCLTATRAVRANLADGVATLDDVLESLGINRARIHSGATRTLDGGSSGSTPMGEHIRGRRRLAVSRGPWRSHAANFKSIECFSNTFFTASAPTARLATVKIRERGNHLKDAKKTEEASAKRANAIRQAWVERNRVCGEAMQTLLQLEGWLSEHSKGLEQQFLRCSRFKGGVGRVVQNGTVACMEDNPDVLARQLLAGKSLEDIIHREQERPRLKAFYASVRFNEEAAPDVVTSADDDLPVLKRWNGERAAVQILRAAIKIQKQAVMAKTVTSMEKFSRDVAEVRGKTARDVLTVLTELKCAVESDQRLVEGLEPDELACLRPRPFPLQILSSEAITWMLDAISQKMIDASELGVLQLLETVKSVKTAPPPEMVSERWIQEGQI